LSRQLRALRVPPPLLAEVDAQRDRLGAIVLSPSHPPAAKRAVQHAVAQSFVSGFRWVMWISALLALASAAGAWFLIGGKPAGK
jgi:type VI protein secretion system component VasF